MDISYNSFNRDTCDFSFPSELEYNISTLTLNNLNISVYDDSKSISDNSKPPIFEIIKEKNQKKKSKIIYFFQEKQLLNGKHTKYCKDNIFRRIKVHFFKFIIEFTNDYIKKVFKKRIIKFKKAGCNQFISDVTIKFNHILKKLTLSNILCLYDNVNQSEKKNSNKNKIEFLIKECKDFETFFSLTYEELYSFFICDKRKKIELQKKYGLKKAIIMEEYINNQIKLGYDDEEYADLFRKYAKAFYFYLDCNNARRSTKNKFYKSSIQNII